MRPSLSPHFQSRVPSPIRLAQIEFMKRTDSVTAINTAIGNVSLPLHPAMKKRMFALDDLNSPFKEGVVKYTSTVGLSETNQAFLHLIEASGFSTEGIYSQVTDGASSAMELVLLGVAGPAGSKQKPLLAIDPTYSNYSSLAERIGRPMTTLIRHLDENGKFQLPKTSLIEKKIEELNPSALLIIPYDNPSGQFLDQKTIDDLARLAVKHNLWLISDEAYRELSYVGKPMSSIWGISEVPGIAGRRISLESASKVWNGCGLRIGALLTDNFDFHQRAVAEYTANLCANAIGQYIFGALLHESKESLQHWFRQQRAYYSQMIKSVSSELKREVPGLIISEPDSSIYTVVDMRNLLDNAADFAMYCAQKGSVLIDNVPTTLLIAPMDGFYLDPAEGLTQLRIAYVEPPALMAKVPALFARLLSAYSKIN